MINFECEKKKKKGRKVFITHNLSIELHVKLNVFLFFENKLNVFLDLFFENKNGE